MFRLGKSSREPPPGPTIRFDSIRFVRLARHPAGDAFGVGHLHRVEDPRMGVVSFAPGFAETFPDSFRHEALFYSGTGEFVERTSAFIRDGIDSGEPVLALVVGPKIDLLRRELSSDADRVFWADMAEVGRNPGRIISVWRDFVAVHAGGRGGHVRGIG